MPGLNLPQRLGAQRQHVTAYTAVAAVIVLTFLSGCWYAAPVRSRARHKQALTLMMTFTFGDKTSMEQWRTAWVPLADYVRRSEPTTLTYELFAPLDNPLQLMVLERYVNAHAFNATHRTSDAIDEYRIKVRGLNFTITSKLSYRQQDLGFMS